LQLCSAANPLHLRRDSRHDHHAAVFDVHLHIQLVLPRAAASQLRSTPSRMSAQGLRKPATAKPDRHRYALRGIRCLGYASWRGDMEPGRHGNQEGTSESGTTPATFRWPALRAVVGSSSTAKSSFWVASIAARALAVARRVVPIAPSHSCTTTLPSGSAALPPVWQIRGISAGVQRPWHCQVKVWHRNLPSTCGMQCSADGGSVQERTQAAGHVQQAIDGAVRKAAHVVAYRLAHARAALLPNAPVRSGRCHAISQEE
jgi:hypothetical protein